MSEDVTTIPWYGSYFGEEYFEIYGPMLSGERTVCEVEGIIKLLDLPQGSRILDSPAATGGMPSHSPSGGTRSPARI